MSEQNQIAENKPNVSQHYLGEKGEKYSAKHQGADDHEGYDLDAGLILPYIRKKDLVLDFGCGNGSIARRIKKKAARLEALEVNPAAAAIARERGIEKVYPDLASLPGKPTFDVIYTNHVLEHVRDVCGTLEELRKSLKPGGRLIAKLPIDDVHHRHQKTWSEDDIDHHIQTWTPRLFANVLMESGYRVKTSRILTHAWHPKLFWLGRISLGRKRRVGDYLWPMLSWYLNRRQVFAIGINPK